MPQIGNGPFSSPQVESDVNRNMANNKRLQVNHPSRIQADQQQAQNAQNKSWMRFPGSPMPIQQGHVIGVHDASNRNTIDPKYTPGGMGIMLPHQAEAAIDQSFHQASQGLAAANQRNLNVANAGGNPDLIHNALTGHSLPPLEPMHPFTGHAPAGDRWGAVDQALGGRAPTHNVMPRQMTGVAATSDAPKLAAPQEIEPLHATGSLGMGPQEIEGPHFSPFSERQAQSAQAFPQMIAQVQQANAAGGPRPPMPGNVPDPMHQALAGGGGPPAPQPGQAIPPQIARIRQDTQQNIAELPGTLASAGVPPERMGHYLPLFQSWMAKAGPQEEIAAMKALADIRLSDAQAQHLGQQSPEDQMKMKLLDEYGPQAMALMQTNPADPSIPRLKAMHQAQKVIPHIQSHIMGSAAETEKSILGHHPDINPDMMAELKRSHFPPEEFQSLIHGQDAGRIYGNPVPPQPWARGLDPGAVQPSNGPQASNPIWDWLMKPRGRGYIQPGSSFPNK